jgi:hypothetical protein
LEELKNNLEKIHYLNKDRIRIKFKLDDQNLIAKCVGKAGGILQSRKDLMKALLNYKKLGLKSVEGINLIMILFVLFDKKLKLQLAEGVKVILAQDGRA